MKKLPVLRPRLRQLAEMVSPCRCMADLGTDHAYLPVWLFGQNRCDSAIACDLRSGPLDRAKKTIAQYHMETNISLRLGDGAKPLQPGEADCIVIAGMGGLLVGEILAASPAVFAAANQILLQPMSSLPELRAELVRLGYEVTDERLSKEDSKLYHILSITPAATLLQPTRDDLYFGHHLLYGHDPHRGEYLAACRQRLIQKYDGLRRAHGLLNTAEIEKTEHYLHTLQIIESEVLPCEK